MFLYILTLLKILYRGGYYKTLQALPWLKVVPGAVDGWPSVAMTHGMPWQVVHVIPRDPPKTHLLSWPWRNDLALTALGLDNPDCYGGLSLLQ